MNEIHVFDPDRRTDPGSRFPWSEFLAAFQARMETAMQETPAHAIQRMLNANGAQPTLVVDGVIGPRTAQALDEVLRWLNQLAGEPGIEQDMVAKLQARMGEAGRLIEEAAELERRAVKALQP